MPEDSKHPDGPGLIVSLSRYSEIGFIIPAAIVLGYAIGKLLDHWLHTHWVYLAGVIVGAVAGFIEMIRMAWALTREKP
jgi:F0F1-type ATP synthase assembly protein I